MQVPGKVQYLPYHQASVRGVAFHPKDRYLFCSGAYDGLVNLYSAQKGELIQQYTVTSVSLARNINAVRFTSDGRKIIATSTARRLTVIDVERGDQLLAYDNCVFNGRDRTGLAVDPIAPNIVVCCCVNGKGLSVFDLRMPLPLDFLYDVHQGIIRDITFLPNSWPWCKGQRSILSVGSDGLCKVTTLDGRQMHAIDSGQCLNTATPTPEPFDSALEDGFPSLLMLGGDYVSTYVPDCGIKEILRENINVQDNHDIPIWKLRYTSNGSCLYTACDQGVVRKYRRWPDRHQYLGEVFHHKADIEDMDISSYDEYLVTASKDRMVGLLKLGPPSHGVSEYSELT